MNDRDRLAADLHEIACGASARAEWDLCVRDHRHEADRLIALGWTRLNPGSLSVLDGVPHTHPDGFPCLACGRDAARSARNTLDEERLARALHRMAFGGGSDGVPTTYEYDVGFLTYSGEATSASLAHAIAKAYRENTDAHD